ncbi:hypothetical protein F0562_004299 [Nyssa sinensis]|uniref:O-fucosyltransferase family protein n=1 Tax=Nyssa sinensis TaxID=561372 RepID=A0A5J5C116_9ASTE|nr:hypothetical protein F0562_004299 [Nyssa sinensis]
MQIFSWRPILANADLSNFFVETHPCECRSFQNSPILQMNGFIFVRIQGVIPEIQTTASSKGISSEFKSFAYLYNEDHFMVALAEDVRIVKTLPKNLKGAKRKKEVPSFRVPHSASPYFYLHHILPVLNWHSVVELVVSDGGCLQVDNNNGLQSMITPESGSWMQQPAILPSYLEENQRLRCRVAFHALQFRQEVQELATKILYRLRAPGQPFITYDPGMTRDAFASCGCAELFQDVHTELIQHRRSWIIKRGIVKGNLSVNSAEQHLNGSCRLMPEEPQQRLQKRSCQAFRRYS